MFPASMMFFIGHSSIKDVIHIAVHDCISCRIATNQCKSLGRKSYSPNQRRQVMLIASTGDAAVAALL